MPSTAPKCLKAAAAGPLPRLSTHPVHRAFCLQGKMYHSDCLSISLEAFGPLPAGKWVAVMQVHCCLPSGQTTAEL